MFNDDSDKNRNPSRIVPERIREAREAIGYSSEGFAELIDVSRQALAQFESGQTQPRPEVLSSIVAETHQPISFFTSQKRYTPSSLGQPFWRSLKRTTTNYRSRTVRRLEWALEITKHIEEYIKLPVVNLPDVDFDHEWPEEIYTDKIEQIADNLRMHWGLGFEPIEHLEKHLEANGIILIRENVLTDDMDAVSRWQSGRPFILYAEEVKSAPRIYFNLAHELGHMILHAGVEVNSKNIDRIEKQANGFAGAFLLPQKTFSREALRSSIEHFRILKSRWGVAIAAMIYRCKDLNIITKHQYSYLWRQMNAQGIRKKEPLDDIFPIPTPSMLLEAATMLFENGVTTKNIFLESLAFSSEDVASLLNVKSSFFEKKVIQFDLKYRDSVVNDNEH